MSFEDSDFAFWVCAPVIAIAGFMVAPDIGDLFEESARPDVIVHEGEIFSVQTSTQHYASIVGGELIIWDAQMREMIDDAYILTENFETSGEQLIDMLTTGNPHVGDVWYRIGEGGPVQRTSIVSTFPAGQYYVQTGPVNPAPRG